MPECKKIVYILLLLFSVQLMTAQQFSEKGFGGNAGIVIALGNRFDRLGFSFNGFYKDNFFQGNAGFRLYYNFRNLGPKKQYLEGQTSLGVVFGMGRTDTIRNRFVNSVSNQTSYLNSIAYSYNVYFNKIGTTQQTGIFAFQFYNFSLLTENDIYARPMLDRFRTGAFLLQYQYQDFQFGINTTLWTGQMGCKVNDGSYPSAHGCMDTTGATYAHYSHGLLSAQVKYIAPYYQTAQLSLGIDAEQVRHAVQNRFIHDMPFVPKKWNKANNAHIPMLDDKGEQYLYKEGQKIRPARFYYNVFLNPALFY
jgi:hypothetical protein